MFGRMEAYKGLEVLVEAAERLHAAGRPVRLVIAGKGPEQTRLAARIAALPGAQAIDRYLEPGDLQAEIARAACVVAPYLDATQSGVLASAFANGKPVVASRVGGLGDVVHDGANGLLVPPGDAAALARAIGRILDDAPLREALTEGAQAFAAGALNWNSIAARILDFSPEV
jgi:glycosyltransferase involved in cell wall biosynthesis